MTDLIKYICQSIVNYPDDVVVKEEKNSEGEVMTKLQVNPDDIKIIIGKKGKTIKAIRTLVKLAAYQNNQQIRLVLEE